MFDLARKILTADTNDLRTLARIAEQDSSTFYSDANFDGIDIRGQDLRGFDLSNAQFSGVRANALTKLDDDHRNIVLRAALETFKSDDIFNLFRPTQDQDPEYIALLAAVGDIKTANRLLEKLIESKIKLPLFNFDIIECGIFSNEIENLYFNRWYEDNNREINCSFNISISLYVDKKLNNLETNVTDFVSRFVSSGKIANVILALFNTRMVFKYDIASLMAIWIRRHARHEKIPAIWKEYLSGTPRHSELDKLVVKWLRGNTNESDYDIIFFLAAKDLKPRIYYTLFIERSEKREEFIPEMIEFIVVGLNSRNTAKLAAQNLLKSILSELNTISTPALEEFSKQRDNLSSWSIRDTEFGALIAEIDRLSPAHPSKKG